VGVELHEFIFWETWEHFLFKLLQPYAKLSYFIGSLHRGEERLYALMKDLGPKN
jgi:hypothetical protein